MNKTSNFAVVLILVAGGALANGDGEQGPPGPPGPQGPPGIDGTSGGAGTTSVTNITGIDNNEFHSSIAATMAADAIHCTTSSRKHQMGVGMGYDDGHSGFAAGYCHSIEIKGQPVMIGVKATTATDTKPKYSVGMNWTF